ncbi:sulfite exporter TauE/SafE family protein [Levilactobacillus bambusae]|uniref:Probable membrane transporter protein n=1 Tax=Levilactobacillus bambusae TaxID=2024736 RepID=A0A2V1N057_9LACO|nr:sulfite exporter TauE/SafE family protein [Levilactobacillus bambusae]PWG00403.1 permease [Levilactobacillus bambusae]
MLITTLIIVGILAGLCQTVAGLASLVSYPALLALGLPPITANVTNTVSLVFSGVSSTLSSQRELRTPTAKRELFSILPVMLLGCICGALLLFVIPAKAFTRVVPFFILFAAFAELLPQPSRPDHVSWPRRWLAFTGIFFVGMYSGYFGAAAGVLMLALLGIISTSDFPTYNAEKNVVFAITNVLSSIIYAAHTKLLWRWILPLGCGFLIGGYLGPIIVRHAPVALLKVIICFGAVVLAVTLFIQAYF